MPEDPNQISNCKFYVALFKDSENSKSSFCGPVIDHPWLRKEILADVPLSSAAASGLVTSQVPTWLSQEGTLTILVPNLLVCFPNWKCKSKWVGDPDYSSPQSPGSRSKFAPTECKHLNGGKFSLFALNWYHLPRLAKSCNCPRRPSSSDSNMNSVPKRFHNHWWHLIGW